jgi:hypothetical protein
MNVRNQISVYLGTVTLWLLIFILSVHSSLQGKIHEIGVFWAQLPPVWSAKVKVSVGHVQHWQYFCKTKPLT